MENFIVKYRDIFYFWMLARSLRGCASVLDVGCGTNSPIARVKKTFRSVGIDIFKPTIAKSKKDKIHDSYVVGDIAHLDRYFKPKSFDAIVALDVVEHLPKKVSLAMIAQMEKIAKKRVIILTPNGFYEQKTLEGNPYQEHKSGWSVQDFTSRGYMVRGLRGLKYLRKEFASIRYRPWFVWAPISFISEPILYFFPRLSYHILAVKGFK